MKKIISIVILTLVSSVVSAQGYVRIDTVIRPYIQFDYTAWIDSGNPMVTGGMDLQYYYHTEDTFYIDGVAGDLLQYNYIEGGADIVGLTVWMTTICGPHSQGDSNRSSGLFPSEYLYLYDATPDSFVQKGLFTIDVFNPAYNNTLWPSREPPVGSIYTCDAPMYTSYHLICDDSCVYEYHHYFDKPVHVDDSFYVGVSCNYFEYIELYVEWLAGWQTGGQTEPLPPRLFGQYCAMTTEGPGGIINPNLSRYGEECQMPWLKQKIRWRYDNSHINYLDNHYPLNEWVPTKGRDFWLVFPLIQTYDTIWTVEYPPCDSVTRFGLMSRFGDTVILRWNPNSEYNEYQVSYGPEGTAPDSGTFVSCNTNKWRYIDTVLNGATMVAYVRTVCREPDTIRYSEWSNGVTWLTRNSGIADHASDNRLRIIPNPATEYVTLFSDYFINGIDIYRSGGSKHTSVTPLSHTASFTVKNWPKGLYIVVVHTPLGDITKKLVVE